MSDQALRATNASLVTLQEQHAGLGQRFDEKVAELAEVSLTHLY